MQTFPAYLITIWPAFIWGRKAADLPQDPPGGENEFRVAPFNIRYIIFCPLKYKVRDFKVLTGRYDGGHYPSDHLPVSSIVGLAEP